MFTLIPPVSRLKSSVLFLCLLLLAVTTAPDIFAQHVSEDARSKKAVPVAPMPKMTDVHLDARLDESHDRSSTSALRRARLRQQLLQPVSAAPRPAGNLLAPSFPRIGSLDGIAAQEESSNTWWYVAGGAAVLGLVTGAAVLLSGGGGGSGESIPPPPNRP